MDMVKEAVSKMKKGKATGPPWLVSEIEIPAGTIKVNLVTDLINQILVVGIILAQHYFLKVRDASERVNCWDGNSEIKRSYSESKYDN